MGIPTSGVMVQDTDVFKGNNLLRDFQTRVVVDPCQFVVSIGIDNYIRNISLSKFEYGKYLLSYSYYILTNTTEINME
jgi:hypothetical protein